MDGQNKRWLVNKDSEVLGPLALQDVVRGVKDGEFDLKMEAKLPGGGWRLLTQHAEIIEALRLEGVSLPSDRATTSTAHLTQSTTVQNATQTEPTDSLLQDEDYPEVTVVHGAPLPPKTPPPQENAKVYQWAGAPASPPARVGGYLIWVVVLALAAVGGWGLYQYKSTGTSPLAGAEDLRGLIEKGNQHLEVGRWQEALWHYRKALEVSPHSTEVQLKVIPLLLREEHHSVLAGRLIRGLRISLTRPEELKILFNLKGLSDLYAGRWPEARAAFEESLQLDSIYGPALWNRSMSYFMEGDFESAITDFAGLKSAFPEMAELFHQWSIFAAGFRDRVDFDHLIQPRFAFQQESFLLGLWMSSQMEDGPRARLFADRLLTSDVSLSELHARDPSLYLEPIRWESLLSRCLELEGHLDPKWQEEAVLGLCQLKAQNSAAALSFFEKSFSRQQSPLTQTLLAYLYFTQGELDRAKLLLSESSSSEDLGRLLLLRIKALENDPSQMDSWVEALADGRYALQKEYFRSWLALKKGATDKARFHWRKTQTLSPNFYPARELRREIYRE